MKLKSTRRIRRVRPRLDFDCERFLFRPAVAAIRRPKPSTHR